MGKLILLILLLPGLVFATEKMKNRDGTPITINSNNTNNSVRMDDHSIDVASESLSESSSMSDSMSDSNASNGDQVSMNSSQFYALSVMFPQASGCFTGVQGGANDNDQGGFLGLHWLNTSCWLNQIASTERDIELNARLLCGDRKYRNAIAFDAKSHGLSKREHCINLKANSGRQEMQDLVDQITQLQENNTAMMGEHSKIVEECEAANARGDERLAKCEDRNFGGKGYQE